MANQNMQPRKFEILFNEIVMGTGFFTGLYYAIGVDPIGILFSTTMQAATIINPNADLTPFKLLSIIPIILTIASLVAAYALGRLQGLLSVFIALLSGLTFVHYPFAGLILLFLAALVAYVAVISRESASNNDYY